MRQPFTPSDESNTSRNRARGAIRTHLGRKRNGRELKGSTLERINEVTGAERHRREDLFDRMSASFQEFFARAGEKSLEAFDSALEASSQALLATGEVTEEMAGKLRQSLRRDLLHRENPALTFRSGDITTPGTLSCTGCGWTIVTSRTAVLPPCPHCGETSYRKTGQ
ncbi:MAG TPA: hypothetical protein VLT89_10515 [Usitatibacter sp.]|nr:hypothetical protein [Usitatibacter sp.]